MLYEVITLAWLLKDKRVTSVLIGASSVQQLDDNVAMTNHLNFSEEELLQIENILTQ